MTTYVGDEDLGATTHGATTVTATEATTASKAGSSKTAAKTATAAHTAATTAARVEAGLGLTVLQCLLVMLEQVNEVRVTHLADVDQATHEIPVAHGVDRGLGLFLGRILNNTTSLHPGKPYVNQVPQSKTMCAR